MVVTSSIPWLFTVTIAPCCLTGRRRIASLVLLGKFFLFGTLIYATVVIFITAGSTSTAEPPSININGVIITSTAPLSTQTRTQKHLENNSNSPVKGVDGWSIDTNRDVKLYVKPNDATALHEPQNVCRIKNEQKRLFLLVIVCSSVVNFDRRQSIRESWGNYAKFKKRFAVFNKVREKYKNYNYEHALYPQKPDVKPMKPIITLLELLTKNQTIKEETKVENLTENDEHPEFRLVFLLGMLLKDNDTIQRKVQDEINEFNDIIQEGFIDAYNNLTLKSIMMLKWVTNKCSDSVRYIMKTDDDTYVNVPNLILNLKERSRTFDKMAERRTNKEYLLVGDLIKGAKPVKNSASKWFSPNYMYSGKKYPNYMSGMAYLMSMPTALALYDAALRTNYFHLEDIYITGNGYLIGMCALHAKPRIQPQDEPLFSLRPVRAPGACRTYNQITVHRVPARDMRALHNRLLAEAEVDKCERMRLTRLRQERIRRNLKSKKPQHTSLKPKILRKPE